VYIVIPGRTNQWQQTTGQPGDEGGSAVVRELDQLRKKVKELTLRLEREARARKLDARLAALAKKAREQLTGGIKALREQGRKLASQLKSTLGDAGKREQALQEARAKVGELKVELGRKTEHLRRKSGELKKLAGESAHRAAAIIRGDAEHATEPVEVSHTARRHPRSCVRRAIRATSQHQMAKRKTEEESLAQRKPDAAQLPKVEIDFETLVAAGIAAAIIRSPNRRRKPRSNPAR